MSVHIVKSETVGKNTITMFYDSIKDTYGLHTTVTKQLFWNYPEVGAELTYKNWLKRFKQIQKFGRYEDVF